MKDNGNISQYRSRLDQTLSSDDLVDYAKLKSLVENQILRSSECDLNECSENTVDRRTKEVANFLRMLRSASVSDSEASRGGWKVKQDSEEIRVMYREGPEGTPYHTLLAEGYVDGPIDVCLCISCEAELYKKWWPQTTIPTFKIAVSKCLQKDVVRVDLVGGFALQKVTDNRSYFRTVGNLDVKLNFIPSALINFVARQLVGGGFKLYKKEVASVAKGDEDFSKALKDPMYARIREALYCDKIPNGDIALEMQDLKKNAVPLDEETRTNYDEKCPEQKVHSEIEVIEDEACEKIEYQNQDDRNIHDSPVNQLVQKTRQNENVGVSPEVKQALETLDKAISIIREYRYNLETSTVSDISITSPEAEADSLKDSKQEFREATSYEHRNSSCSRRTSSSLCTRDAPHNKIAPASPDVYAAIPGVEAHHIALRSSTDQETSEEIREKILNDDNGTVADENGIYKKQLGERKIRKLSRYCCYFLSEKVVA